MGYIYSEACEVIAVLSPTILPSLTYMRENKQLDVDEPHMFALQGDEWVTRAWTYQEAVNAKCLSITCEGSGHIIISGQEFLNRLGHMLDHLPVEPLERRVRYPRLDALEDLVDYLTAAYEERSALQVMAKMDRRSHGRPEDHFYAMIGAISSHLASSTGAESACEAFMLICERKGDFSFIYSVAPRTTEPGRRWRPVPGDLPAVLQWDCTGAGEPGRMIDGGLLLLEEVVKLGLGDLSAEADKFIHDWLDLIGRQLPKGASPADLRVHVFDALRLMGFTGPGESYATTIGLFLPVSHVSQDEVDHVLVSSSLRWIFGSPGLLCCRSGEQVCAINSSGSNGRPDHGGGVRPIDNKHKTSFAQWVRDLFRTNDENKGQPEPPDDSLLQTRDLEITVHDTTPNITEVVAVACDERRRKVTVDVKVSASVTARSRRLAAGGRPVLPTKWLVKRSAQAKFRRSKSGTCHSVAMATEKATRDAAEEAHNRAITLATMNAAAKALGDVAAQARGVL
ncbi:hypothetical protein SLS53_004189 [Cytospora paraplurivora]|uniref:Heterokaryon incompatibility domain-containing protein n=1 Tax=Cytospora paraplurivora TaxID=2898453 RepID=A0AAN9YHE5_9PEZI